MAPTRGSQRALRKDRTVFGDVFEHHALVVSGEDDVVLAHHRAAAQCGKADDIFLAGAGVTVAGAHGFFVQRNASPISRCLPQQQRGARRRIDLHAVMHFDDLDVEIRQCLGGLLHQGRQQIDTQAHISGCDDDGMARGGADLAVVIGGESGCADHMGDARLRGQRGELDRYFGAGEIANRIGAGDQR